MRDKIDILPIVLFGFLLLIWIYPGLLSIAGVGVAMAWIYGILFARIFKMILQYGVLHWGVNRYGVMALGTAMLVCGLAVMYLGWRESMYTMMGIGWMITFAGFDSAHTSYRRQLSSMVWSLMTYLQYLLVALAALVIFGGYIKTSPIGEFDIVYQGIAGESLWFIAMVVTGCEVVHMGAIRLWDKIESLELPGM